MAGESRFTEIDLFRGIAILMMVLFHTLFDISFFGIAPINVESGFWRYFAFATATLFLFLVGVSLIVSHARAARYLAGFALARKFLLRGAGIFLLGLGITVATWFYLREGFILFGILHLIGISVMLSPLFFRFRKYNIAIGIACLLIGWFVIGSISPVWSQSFGIQPAGAWSVGYAPMVPWTLAGAVVPLLLLPLGIHAASFMTVDYEPLFPFFGVVLIGMGAGEFLYGEGIRHFTAPRVPEFLLSPFSFLGRHSLLIYLVHQPVIVLLLGAITGAKVL
jgi:uncharacterized membrane protein